MARLQDYPNVTPTSSDKLLVVQSQGQGLVSWGSTIGAKFDKSLIKRKTVSGTTAANGSLNLSLNNANNVILSAFPLSQAGAQVAMIAGLTSGSTYIVLYGVNGEPLGNTATTIQVNYLEFTPS